MALRLVNSPFLSFFTCRIGNVTIGKWFIDRDRDFGKAWNRLIYYDLVKLFAKWSSKGDWNVYFLHIFFDIGSSGVIF